MNFNYNEVYILYMYSLVECVKCNLVEPDTVILSICEILFLDLFMIHIRDLPYHESLVSM